MKIARANSPILVPRMNTKSWLLRQIPFTGAVSYLVNFAFSQYFTPTGLVTLVPSTNPNMVYAGNLTITEKFRFSIKLLNKYGLALFANGY